MIYYNNYYKRKQTNIKHYILIITELSYAIPSIRALGYSNLRPTVNANKFEIKIQVIQNIQNSCIFLTQDAHAHIPNFLEICDTFKLNDVSNNAIRLRACLLSLRDHTKAWLNSPHSGSITT